MSDENTNVARVVVDEYGVDFLITPRAEWLPDFLAPLIPERDYSATVAKCCIDSDSFVVGEAANEYEGWVL